MNGPFIRPAWAPENWFINAKKEHDKKDYRYDLNGKIECIDIKCCACVMCVMQKESGLFCGQPVGMLKNWSSIILEKRGYVGLYWGKPPSRDVVLAMEREFIRDQTTMFDNVQRPYHYNACGETDENGRSALEPIRVIEAWGLGYGFCMGNALKYILRAPYKGSERVDLEKALWYLDRIAASGMAEQPIRTDGSCHHDEVAKAWDLDAELEMAVEHINLGHPAAAARAVREYLVIAGMADSICEAEDERILDEVGDCDAT